MLTSPYFRGKQQIIIKKCFCSAVSYFLDELEFTVKALFISTDQTVGSTFEILLSVLSFIGFRLTVLFSQYAGPEQYHIVDATYRVREAKKQLYSENGRHPDNEEIAGATGLSLKRIMTVLLTPKAPRSLDQKMGIDQTLKASVCLLLFCNTHIFLCPSAFACNIFIRQLVVYFQDLIADPDAETPEEVLTKQLLKKDLDKVLDSLNSREKQVVRWRFGLEDGRMKTLQEIGELMGVSRERIRQIESCAFRKLKNKKRTENLKQYLIS